MIHALLDTNIYGLMFEDPEGLEFLDRIASDRKLLIHNFRPIRNELRRAPQILPFYDRLVAHTVISPSPEIDALAEAYFEQYKTNGGVQGKERMLPDFRIVACASLKRFDIIFSEDKTTLVHAVALTAYRTVNLKRSLRTPQFYSYSDLKRRYF